MSTHFDAFDLSPVPTPAWDATPPEEYRGIYGMLAFTTVCTTDLPASVKFRANALGLFTLFEIPGQLVHLRRWAFQDVLLVPGARAGEAASSAVVNFWCVLHQIEPLVTTCRRFDDVAVTGPRDTPWNSHVVEIVTPNGFGWSSLRRSHMTHNPGSGEPPGRGNHRSRLRGRPQ